MQRRQTVIPRLILEEVPHGVMEAEGAPFEVERNKK